jgi:hypothetical protein
VQPHKKHSLGSIVRCAICTRKSSDEGLEQESLICENARGQFLYVDGQARYVREPQLRAPLPLCAGRDRDDGPPDGDDERRRGDERRRCGDADPPDASVTVPFYDTPP